MNILHINSSDKIGGAAKASMRHHLLMKKNGINSSLLVQRRSNNVKQVFNISNIDQIFYSAIRRRYNDFITRKSNSLLGGFSPSGLGVDITSLPLFKKADLIYLHYVNSGFLNINSIINILESGKPVIWFMHDMWPFTGGCHYSYDCLYYEKDCSNCMYFSGNNSLPKRILNKKRKLSQYENLIIVSPSRWLMECSLNSALFRKLPHFHIPNTLDVEVFKPLSKIECRKMFNIPLEKKILLFGAIDAVNNPYKGWSNLKLALNHLKLKSSEDIEIVVFGSEEDITMQQEILFPLRFVGYLHDDYTLSALYNSVDVFLPPSLTDNFPNTILESQFCGIPCVVNNVGGVSEMIKNNETGFVANKNNPISFADGIIEVLSCDYKKNDISMIAHNRFGNKIVIEKHFEIMRQYDSLKS